MEPARFDRFVRALSDGVSRRGLLRAIAGACGAAIASLTVRPATASAGVPIGCGPGLADCDGICVDLQVDGFHCGQCGNWCAPGFCAGGTCVTCFVPQHRCGDLCIDVAGDANHCGACFNACGSDQYCLGGACYDLIPACVAPLIPCGDQCVDAAGDVNHCATCDNDCASFGYGYVQPACCSGVCVDLDSHVNHCGACGLDCGADRFCTAGSCACLPDLTDCGGLCVDGGSDPNNCGACGRTCAHQGGVGLCCFGACIDQTSDPANCGGCEIVCGAGQTCVNGTCSGAGPEPTCPAGRLACGGVCVDPATAHDHCGGCDQPCPTSRQCVAGRCRTTEAAPPSAATDDPWRLWLGSTKLRGAALYQRRRTAADELAVMGEGAVGPVYGRGDLDRLVALGANYVEIVHPAVVAESPPFDLDPAIVDSLDQLVDTAATAGLFVVVSFRTGPGRPESSLSGEPRCRAGGCFASAADARPLDSAVTLWTDEAAQAGWEVAWGEVADRYRAHPAVIGYHLLDGPEPPDPTAWSALARRLTGAIRASDERMPILVTLPGRPADSFAEPLIEDTRTVHLLDRLEPERYLTQPPDASGALTYPGRFNEARDDADGAFDRGWLEEVVAPLLTFEDREQRPTAVRAIGVPRWQPGAAGCLDDAMSVCDGAGLNYTLWAWYPAGWPALGDAFDVTRGPDPANHEAVESELLDVVRRNWRENDDRPTNRPQ